MDLIQVSNLVKKYGDKKVVSDISLNIKKGDVFGLLGPNGAGKSTTISMISGLLKPTEGNIVIDGKDISKNPKEAKKHIGLVPQDIALYPTLSAEDNLLFWGKMYGIRGQKLKERVAEVLKIANLEDKKKEKVGHYSGGMKRRINIAAALIHEPDILVMDEPTVGIDPQSRNHILETVKKLNKEGLTIIYTSHYMEEVEYLCNNVAIVDGGKILAMGEKEELKRSVLNSDKVEIKVSSINKKVVENLKKLSFIENLKINEDKKVIELMIKNASEVLFQVMEIVNQSREKILQVKIEEPNLESVFLSLTGKALRE